MNLCPALPSKRLLNFQLVVLPVCIALTMDFYFNSHNSFPRSHSALNPKSCSQDDSPWYDDPKRGSGYPLQEGMPKNVDCIHGVSQATPSTRPLRFS